jgi:hypothetical protein
MRAVAIEAVLQHEGYVTKAVALRLARPLLRPQSHFQGERAWPRGCGVRGPASSSRVTAVLPPLDAVSKTHGSMMLLRMA